MHEGRLELWPSLLQCSPGCAMGVGPLWRGLHGGDLRLCHLGHTHTQGGARGSAGKCTRKERQGSCDGVG